MRIGFRKNGVVALALLLGACGGNTTVQNSWKDPTAPSRRFNKVLNVFISSEANTRRSGEDAMTARIPRSVSSYTVLPDSVLTSTEKAKAFVVSQGFDGAVLMRPVAVDKETTYVPGTSTYAVPAGYRSAWGYWGTGWGGAYDPGHYRQDQVVFVESNVYSLTDDKLLWSAKTKTYNPDNIPKMVNEIVDQSVAEMKKQGIVPATMPSQ